MLQLALQYRLNYWSRDFFDAFGRRGGSALLTLAMAVIGRRMIHVIAGKNAAEAQFRSVAANLRERGAAALTVDDGPARHRLLSGVFDTVIERFRNLCVQFMRITLVSHGNILAAPVIGWVLCAPKYLDGTMSLGEAAQVVAASVMVQTALNWLADNYPGMAECLSSVNRVGSLLMALDEVSTVRDDRSPDGSAAVAATFRVSPVAASGSHQ